uniref:Uncharacterized protein n=1 Tax=Anguilla anguilla TaxID=7936 RepID=A0A0E9PN07_ANGAN
MVQQVRQCFYLNFVLCECYFSALVFLYHLVSINVVCK